MAGSSRADHGLVTGASPTLTLISMGLISNFQMLGLVSFHVQWWAKPKLKPHSF